MKKSHKIYTIAASFFVMLIIAITENVRGILVPTFKMDFGVTDSQIGIFLAIATGAYVFGTFIAGKLSRNMNQKRIAIIGMIIAGLGFILTSFVSSFVYLTIGYIVLTIGISFVVLSLNTIVPTVKVIYISVIINTLHFFYGIGATFTQRVAGYLIANGISWRHIFLAFGALYLLGIVIYSFVDQPKKEEESRHLEKIHDYEVKVIGLFCIALGFYVAAEIQTANWLFNYLSELYHYDANQASSYVAIFFGMIATGRLLGGYVLEKIGYLRGITISLVLALITYSLGLVNEQMLILLSISGIFFSIVFPTTMLVVQNLFERNAMRVVSIVSMSASTINMLTFLVIGRLNDAIGVRLSYLSIPLMLGLSLVLFVMIGREVKKLEAKRKLGV